MSTTKRREKVEGIEGFTQLKPNDKIHFPSGEWIVKIPCDEYLKGYYTGLLHAGAEVWREVEVKPIEFVVRIQETHPSTFEMRIVVTGDRIATNEEVRDKLFKLIEILPEEEQEKSV